MAKHKVTIEYGDFDLTDESVENSKAVFTCDSLILMGMEQVPAPDGKVRQSYFSSYANRMPAGALGILVWIVSLIDYAVVNEAMDPSMEAAFKVVGALAREQTRKLMVKVSKKLDLPMNDTWKWN